MGQEAWREHYSQEKMNFVLTTLSIKVIVGYFRNPLTNVNRNLGHSTKKSLTLLEKWRDLLLAL
jgi:hypothetical protein